MKSKNNVFKWVVGIIFTLIIIIVILKLTRPERVAPVLAHNYSVDTLIVNSSVLNETREILVYTPLEYQQTDSVSVVYFLDGEHSLYCINTIAKEKFDKPIIGIGIVNTDRRRDMLPGNAQEKFHTFISNELIPQIESKFLINQRTLFGHSNAGGFTIYAMIQAPFLFDKYIASSPTPITDMIDSEIYKQLDSKMKTELKFYFSYGSDDKGRVIDGSEKLHENLQKLSLEHIVWKDEALQGEDHNSSSVISLIKGLQF